MASLDRATLEKPTIVSFIFQDFQDRLKLSYIRDLITFFY